MHKPQIENMYITCNKFRAASLSTFEQVFTTFWTLVGCRLVEEDCVHFERFIVECRLLLAEDYMEYKW